MIVRPAVNAACFALVLCMNGAVAAPDPAYAEAVQEYRAGRWSSAFGRFITLANDGNVESARFALFMQLHGRALYGSDWDASEEDIELWSRMTGTRAPQPVERVTSTGTREPARQARTSRFIPRAASSSAAAGGCRGSRCK